MLKNTIEIVLFIKEDGVILKKYIDDLKEDTLNLRAAIKDSAFRYQSLEEVFEESEADEYINEHNFTMDGEAIVSLNYIEIPGDD